MSKYIKCVMVGDAAVGKTWMFTSYTANKAPKSSAPTVLNNFEKAIKVEGVPYKLDLFDTSGQENDRIRPISYPRTDVFLICFSVVSPTSFSNIKQKWIPEILHHTGNHIPVIIVGTKVDLRSNSDVVHELANPREKSITTEQGEQLAREIGAATYVECSALTQFGLKNVFDEAIRRVVDPPRRKETESKKCLIQ